MPPDESRPRIVQADDRGRVSIGAAAAGKDYSVEYSHDGATVNGCDGQIILTPIEWPERKVQAE